MAEIDMSGLSVPELRALVRDAEAEIKAKEQLRIIEARGKVAEIAKEYGVSVNELLGAQGTGRQARKKSTARPKYRNPANPGQTWSGRGRRPAWLVEQLAQGVTLESFLVTEADT